MTSCVFTQVCVMAWRRPYLGTVELAFYLMSCMKRYTIPAMKEAKKVQIIYPNLREDGEIERKFCDKVVWDCLTGEKRATGWHGNWEETLYWSKQDKANRKNERENFARTGGRSLLAECSTLESEEG